MQHQNKYVSKRDNETFKERLQWISLVSLFDLAPFYLIAPRIAVSFSSLFSQGMDSP